MKSLKLLSKSLTTPRQSLMLIHVPYPLLLFCHEKLEQSKVDDSLLKELHVLQGVENVVYEARNDTAGISFVKSGRRKWVPIVVTKRGREMSAAELKRC